MPERVDVSGVVKYDTAKLIDGVYQDQKMLGRLDSLDRGTALYNLVSRGRHAADLTRIMLIGSERVSPWEFSQIERAAERMAADTWGKPKLRAPKQDA